MLTFNSFKKQYGNTVILDIPSFQLPDGAYWLQAENGKGKSTFLRAISGIIPFSGEVHLDEKNLQKNKQLQRSAISYASAEPLYPGFLSGKELIDFYVTTKKGNAEKSYALALALQIADKLDQLISTYSSGMLKKLSLILAFTGNMKWIFLDEPLITIDKDAVKVIVYLIQEYIQTGTSFIITSHQDLHLDKNVLKNITFQDKSIVFL